MNEERYLSYINARLKYAVMVQKELVMDPEEEDPKMKLLQIEMKERYEDLYRSICSKDNE